MSNQLVLLNPLLHVTGAVGASGKTHLAGTSKFICKASHTVRHTEKQRHEECRKDMVCSPHGGDPMGKRKNEKAGERAAG